MALLRQLPNEPLRSARVRAGGMLALAALLLGSHAVLGDRLLDDPTAHAQSTTATAAAQPGRNASEVLWREPAGTRDLFYGRGGADHQPDAHGTFTFIKEDLDGSQPKLEVRDDN